MHLCLMGDVSEKFDTTGSHRMRTASDELAHVADISAAKRTAWRTRPILLIIICGLLLVGAVIAATAGLLLNLRDRDLVESKRELSRLTLILAEQIDQSFRSIDLIQTTVIERMQSLGIASVEDFERQMSGYDVHRSLKEQISALPYVNAIVLTDAEGKLINFSRSWPIPNVIRPDQDPSEAFNADPRLTTFLGEPLRSPVTGNWVIPVARKFTGPDGKFLGVVTGIIEAQYLEQYFKAITTGPDDSIVLFRRDGTMLVRYPRSDGIIGQPLRRSRLFANRQPKFEIGTVRETGSIDGKDRLISARALAHYPIMVVTTTSVAEALANWKRGAITMTGAALTIGLLIGGVVVFCVWQVGKKLREKNIRLDTAINNMSQGLIMFDSATRLIICNDRYRRIYNLPPELAKPGCSVLDLLKYRAANGTFFGDPEKYIDDLRAVIAQGGTAKQEVEIGDGRIISVVNQPMAAGGWVATHDDVTEAKRQEASFRLLFKNNPVPMWVFDLESLRFLAVNEAAIAHYGYSREQFLAMRVLDIRPPEERERFAHFVHLHGGTHNGEQAWRHQKLDKTIIDVAIYSHALSYDGHRAVLVASIDCTDRKRAEDELRRTKIFLDAVVEHVPLPIIVKDVIGLETDARGSRFTLFNRAYEELTGESRIQLIGKTAHQLFPKERADLIVRSDNETLQSEQAVTTNEHPIITSHNGTRLVKAKKTVIRDETGQPQYLLTVIDDVTERRRAERRIMHMAHYDPLTDLPNRATFNDTMDATLDRAGASREQFAILSIDLDYFKDANDTHGHLVGDALLREVAGRLQSAGEGAFLARVGGDEFAVILADGEQPAAAAALAERLLATFVEDFEVEGHQLKLGMSIGVAIYPTDGTNAKTLITNADVALYRAKAETRGTALFYEPEMGARLRERHTLQENLKLAIDRGELLLHYQPQLTMSGEAVGFEALVRWQCPKHGLVSPGTFIPIAEASSLIIPIGEWVLREACREAASWSQPLTIAVNISPIQFHQGNLPRLVHSILLETGLAPGRLELEITENVMINDFSRAVSILNQLKSLGVRIAMDDFGTGYSSLSYLQSFRCDKIKIDRIFICDLESNFHSRAIVRAVVGLGQSLDLPILAEGVETEAQHSYLVQEGCDEVQGYLTGRPLPIADYAKLVGRQTLVQQHYAVAAG